MTEQTPFEAATRDIGPDAQVSWKSIWEFIKGLWGRLGEAASNPGVMLGVMVAILFLAGALRLTGVDWDEHHHLHPDERFLTMVENSLQWPKSFKEYLDL